MPHGVTADLRIVADDAVRDAVVGVTGGLDGVGWRQSEIGEVEGVPEHINELASQLIVHTGVERPVELAICRRGVPGVVHACCQSVQFATGRCADGAGHLGCQRALQQCADLHHLSQPREVPVPGGVGADLLDAAIHEPRTNRRRGGCRQVGAQATSDLEDSQRPQFPHRLTNSAARHTELSRQILLDRNGISGGQVRGENPLKHPLRRRVEVIGQVDDILRV